MKYELAILAPEIYKLYARANNHRAKLQYYNLP